MVLLGLWAGQFILYGPSLLGRRILLPLDILGEADVYLPLVAGRPEARPHDFVLLDLVQQFEPERRFAAAELAAGRLPAWLPYQYAGVPLVWPRFSPFFFLSYCTASPVVLAWVQLLQATVAGLGAYLFFRRVLGVRFWAAVVPAWAYPLTGFFVFWQGYPTAGSVYWLPWLLLAVAAVLRRPGVRSGAGLAVATGLVLVSGHVDVAGQVLLAGGLLAVWGLGAAWWAGGRWLAGRRAAVCLVLGWGLGFMLAAPHLFPLVEYAGTGLRMERRRAGAEERPPGGLEALPVAVLPDLQGRTQCGSILFMDTPLSESAAGAHAGVWAMLFLAPLAWCSRRHRAMNGLCAVYAVLGLAWCANLPVMVTVFRLPGLNMMSHNRLVFWAGFAALAQAAIGLEVLAAGPVAWRRWFALPMLVLALLGGWCALRVAVPSALITEKLVTLVAEGRLLGWVHTPADVAEVRAWFGQAHAREGLICLLVLAGWAMLVFRQGWSRRLSVLAGVMLLGELLWFAHGRSAQCDPALYYPRIPALEAVARAGPGRVIGHDCLPATLPATHGLADVRGYDSIDPGDYVRLLELAADPMSFKNKYAEVQWLKPLVLGTGAEQVRLSPVLNLLGVRYLIGRGAPLPRTRPIIASPDYWVLENPAALPHVFVPRRVETVADAAARLRLLGAEDFDPRAVAFAETEVALPDDCRGRAEIVSETPTRIEVVLNMETAGLLVLADRWDPGWHARLDGREVPVLRVDHALRGVVVPARAAQLKFYYDPASFRLGLWLCGAAAAGVLGSLLVVRLRAGH